MIFDRYFNKKAECQAGGGLKTIISTKNRNCIVFSMNDDFVKFFSATLCSLRDNLASGEKYDVVILHNDTVSELNQRRLKNMAGKNLNLRFFSVSDYLSYFENSTGFDFPVRAHWEMSSYYRIFIPLIFKNYKRVLYCDSDIIFNSSLKELFSISDDGAEVLAVRDSIAYVLDNERYEERKNKINKELGLKNPYNYINSGVMAFNLENIKDEDEYIERLKKGFLKPLRFLDQDIMNSAFEGRIKFISMVWNFQYHMLFLGTEYIGIKNESLMQDFREASQNPKIIHYTSGCKPWGNPELPFADEFWQNARKTPYYEAVLAAMTEEKIVKSVKEVDLYLKCYNNENIVLWGASLFLEDFLRKYRVRTKNIIGIIDINPQKRGKFIQDYEIFAPEDLAKLNPDVVIVTIVHYKKERLQEVKDYIAKNSKKEIKIEKVI